MNDYETISDEELWGVPPEELPPTDTERNFFNEHQDGDMNAVDDFFENSQ